MMGTNGGSVGRPVLRNFCHCYSGTRVASSASFRIPNDSNLHGAQGRLHPSKQGRHHHGRGEVLRRLTLAQTQMQRAKHLILGRACLLALLWCFAEQQQLVSCAQGNAALLLNSSAARVDEKLQSSSSVLKLSRGRRLSFTSSPAGRRLKKAKRRSIVWSDLSSPSSGSPPSPRYSHAMAASGGVIYVFGGRDYNGGWGSALHNDLHAYSTASRTWTDLSSPSSGFRPSARYSHAMAESESVIYVFGGSVTGVPPSAGYRNDLLAYSTASRSWTDLSSPSSGSPPSARYTHGMAASGGVIYVFGGITSGGRRNDLHAYSTASRTWTDLSSPSSGSPPSARSGHGMAASGGVIYVFGGLDTRFDLRHDLHAYFTASRTWTDLSSPSSGSAPTPRTGHGMAASGSVIYVFGGYDYRYCNDLHAYSPASQAWSDLSSPSSGSPPAPRDEQHMTASGSVLYVFGGYNTGDPGVYLNDLQSCTLDPCPVGSFCPEGTAEAVPCPASFYCPEGAVEAMPCPASFYCPAGAVEAVPCPANFYCSAGAAEALPCLAAPGGYCPASSSSPTTVCPAGFFCTGGSGGAVQCPAGFHCREGSAFASPCTASAGRHCPPQSSTPDGVLCDGGYACAGGTAQPVACTLAGFYCPGGTAQHRECPAGTFCEAGASAQTPCSAEPGFHCSAGSSTSGGAECSPGFFCSGGSSAAKECLEGFYCPDGSSLVTACRAEAGFYCAAGSGTAGGIECPALSYCTGGSAVAKDCEAPSGRFCPAGTANSQGVECEADRFCAGGTNPPDVDRCNANMGNCNVNAECTNTVGSFTCACIAGWTSTDEGVTCSDVDECTENTDNCNANAECTNTVGSFACACTAGYSGDGVTCSDVDECTENTDNCNASAACTNTNGSFACACAAGYSGDGVTCSDVDECTANTDNCDATGTCTNTVGSFACACKADFEGDGISCTALTECSGSGAAACVITFTATLGMGRADFDEDMQQDYVSVVAGVASVPQASVVIQRVRETQQARMARRLLRAQIKVDTAIAATPQLASISRSAIADRLEPGLIETGIEVNDIVVSTSESATITELEFVSDIPSQDKIITTETIHIRLDMNDYLLYPGANAPEFSFKVDGVPVQEHAWIEILVEGGVTISLMGVPELGKYEIKVTAKAAGKEVDTVFILNIIRLAQKQQMTGTVAFQVGLGVGLPVFVGICILLGYLARKKYQHNFQSFRPEQTASYQGSSCTCADANQAQQTAPDPGVSAAAQPVRYEV